MPQAGLNSHKMCKPSLGIILRWFEACNGISPRLITEQAKLKKNRYFLLRRNSNSLVLYEIIATDGRIMVQKMRNRPTAYKEQSVS
jgi:hypothetical protein